jgi:DNA polymerase-1
MAKANQQKFLFGGSEPDQTGSEKSKKSAGKQAETPFIATEPPMNESATIESPKAVVDLSAPFEISELAGKKVVVVDSHSLIYQVFHAMAPMTSPDGRAIHAVYGFTRDILDIQKKYQPDFLICAFDRSEITFRNELYDQYKAHRDPMPEDLRSQIPMIRQLLEALEIPILDLDGYEADDILATISRSVDEAEGFCWLVTSDKDCRQLLGERVQMLNLRKHAFYGPAELEKDWGIRPDQVVDFQAMVGDKADNVPGIATIGPKTATQLLTEFGTLDEVLANTDKIKGKKAERIRESTDIALLSRKLVRLDTDVPVVVPWRRAQVTSINSAAALQLCEEFGFRSLAERVAGLGAKTKAEPVQWDTDYRTIDDASALKTLVDQLRECDRVAVDTETTSTNPALAELVGISLCWAEGKAAYIPIQAPDGESVVDQQEAVELLRPILESDLIEKIGQNLKYDMVVLRAVGLRLAQPLFDTMVADYLINPGQNSHSIDDLAKRYLNYETTSIKQLIGTGKKQIGMNEVPVTKVSDYACEDVDVPWRLYDVLNKQLHDLDLMELFSDLEIPLIDVLAEMESNGIAIDTELLEVISGELAGRLADLKTEIHQLAGGEFNIDSPAQLSEVLFDRLELPVIKKTKTGRSTDVEVLTQLADQHELPALVVEYRQCGKLKSTYTDALVRQLNPKTGRVHTSFKQDVARTGRLSSKDPNLQNIPIRTKQGRRIREAFVPGRDGWKLMMADYSQIELRILAHFCQDGTLQKVFEQDEDIHTAVAAQVYEVSINEVDKDMRRRAKVINFGIIYGQSAFGLSKELGISREEAEEFIDSYYEKYASVDEFMREVLAKARSNRYVSTVLRRRREVEGVRSLQKISASRFRNSAERVAVNTVIQGSAADLIKLAMIRVQRALAESEIQAALLLQIHDELVLEVHPDAIEPLAKLVREQMTQAFQLNVPLKVDIEVGPNWGDAQLIV